MLKSLFIHPEKRFVLTFLLVYAGLYGLNYTWTALTIPGGYYCYWMDNNTDYISGLRNLILWSSSTFLEWFGYNNYVQGHYLHVANVKTVRMVYSCIGLNIICVWWAFNIAFPQSSRKKLGYIVTGSVFITLLNMIRVALVAVSPRKGNFLNTPFDHHTVFNFAVYSIIVIVVFRIINRNAKKQA